MPSRPSALQNPVLTMSAQKTAFDRQQWLRDRIVAKFAGVPQNGTYPTIDSAWTLGSRVGDASTASPASRFQIHDKGSLHPVDYTLSSSTYEMRQKGLEAFVSDRDQDYYLGQMDHDTKEFQAANIMGSAYVAREEELADGLFASGTFTSGTTPSTKWGASGATARAQVSTGADTIRQAVGYGKNELTLVAGAEVANAFLVSSEITAFVDTNNIQFNGSYDVLARNVAIYLGIKDVLFGFAVGGDQQAGQSLSASDIWGDFANLCVIKPGARDTSNAAFCFERQAPAIMEIYSEREQGTYIQCRWDDRLVFNGSYGYLFSAPAS